MSVQKTNLGGNMIWTMLRQHRYLLIIPTILLAIFTLFPRLAAVTFLGFNLLSFSYLYIIANIILALLWNFKLFPILHKRAAVDQLLSLPFSKVKIYGILQITGLIGTLLPSIVIFAVNLLLSIGAPDLLVTVRVFLRILLMTVCSFLFVQFLILLAGKLRDAVISVVLVSVMWPLMVTLYIGFTAKFLPTFAIPVSNWFYNGFRYLLSPFAAMLFHTVTDQYTTLFWVVITVLLFAGCMLLFIKRPAEWSESRWVMTPSFHLVRLIAVPTIAVIGGYLAFEVRRMAVNMTGAMSGDGAKTVIGMTPFYIGFVIAVIISVWAFHLIGGKRGHALLQSALILLLVVAVTGGWLVFVQNGASGYSERLPETNHIESVKIRDRSQGFFDLGMPAMIFTESDDIAAIRETVALTLTEDNPGLALPRTLESDKMYDNYVVDLQFDIANAVQADKKSGDPFWMVDLPGSSNLPYQQVEIEWNLKNGYTMTRSYRLPVVEGSKLWRTFTRNPAFLLELYSYYPWHTEFISANFKGLRLSEKYDHLQFNDELRADVIADTHGVRYKLLFDYEGKVVANITDENTDDPAIVVAYGVTLETLLDNYDRADKATRDRMLESLKNQKWINVHSPDFNEEKAKADIDKLADDFWATENYDKRQELSDYLVVYGTLKIPYSEKAFPNFTEWLYAEYVDVADKYDFLEKTSIEEELLPTAVREP